VVVVPAPVQAEKTTSSRASQYPLFSETKELIFPKDGGSQTITIKNTTQRDLAYQVEASEAEFYSSKPSAQFISVNDTKEITIKRNVGGAEKGLIAIVVQPVGPNEIDPHEVFRQRPITTKRRENCLPLPVRVEKK